MGHQVSLLNHADDFDFYLKKKMERRKPRAVSERLYIRRELTAFPGGPDHCLFISGVYRSRLFFKVLTPFKKVLLHSYFVLGPMPDKGEILKYLKCDPCP